MRHHRRTIGTVGCSGLTVLLLLTTLAPAAASAAMLVPWEGHGTDSIDCSAFPDHGITAGQPYIHWVLNQVGPVDSARMLRNGSPIGDFSNPGGEGAKHAWTDFYDLSGDFAAEVISGGSLIPMGVGAEPHLVISNYCPGIPQERGIRLELVKRWELPDGLEVDLAGVSTFTVDGREVSGPVRVRRGGRYRVAEVIDEELLAERLGDRSCWLVEPPSFTISGGTLRQFPGTFKVPTRVRDGTTFTITVTNRLECEEPELELQMRKTWQQPATLGANLSGVGVSFTVNGAPLEGRLPVTAGQELVFGESIDTAALTTALNNPLCSLVGTGTYVVSVGDAVVGSGTLGDTFTVPEAPDGALFDVNVTNRIECRTIPPPQTTSVTVTVAKQWTGAITTAPEGAAPVVQVTVNGITRTVAVGASTTYTGLTPGLSYGWSWGEVSGFPTTFVNAAGETCTFDPPDSVTSGSGTFTAGVVTNLSVNAANSYSCALEELFAAVDIEASKTWLGTEPPAGAAPSFEVVVDGRTVTIGPDEVASFDELTDGATYTYTWTEVSDTIPEVFTDAEEAVCTLDPATSILSGSGTFVAGTDLVVGFEAVNSYACVESEVEEEEEEPEEEEPSEVAPRRLPTTGLPTALLVLTALVLLSAGAVALRRDEDERT